MTNPIPPGFRTLTPHITVHDGTAAIDFYKRAFGAKEAVRMPGPDGKTVMHAELEIGDSRLMLNDPFPQHPVKPPKEAKTTTFVLHVYTPDVDSFIERAARAGATVTMPATDMFWGDRYGMVSDPFGHVWGVATRKENLTPEEMGARAARAFGEGK